MAPVRAPISKTAAPAKVAGISLDPSTFTEGGLLDDADVSIADAAFLMWDYDGKVNPAAPALGITLKTDDGKDHDEYLSAGKAEYFVPNEDGSGLVPVGDKTALNNNCNAAIFLASLISIGVPVELLASGNIKAIIGMRLHINRVPAPERPGLAQQDPNKKRTNLVATKLLSLPGEAAPAKPALGMSKTATGGVKAPVPAAKAPVAAAPAPAAASDELTAETTGYVIQVLGEAGGTVARKAISPKVFAAAKAGGSADPASVMKLAFTEDFLMSAGDGAWTFDGTNITIA